MTGPPQKLTGANISDSREEPHKLIYSNFVPWMLLEAHLSFIVTAICRAAVTPLRLYESVHVFHLVTGSPLTLIPPSALIYARELRRDRVRIETC